MGEHWPEKLSAAQAEPLPRTDPRGAFKDALCRHYKRGRDEAEQCLADIIKILERDGDQSAAILDRMIQHYGHEQ